MFRSQCQVLVIECLASMVTIQVNKWSNVRLNFVLFLNAHGTLAFHVENKSYINFVFVGPKKRCYIKMAPIFSRKIEFRSFFRKTSYVTTLINYCV